MNCTKEGEARARRIFEYTITIGGPLISIIWTIILVTTGWELSEPAVAASSFWYVLSFFVVAVQVFRWMSGEVSFCKKP
jgi:hypothetical protein